MIFLILTFAFVKPANASEKVLKSVIDALMLQDTSIINKQLEAVKNLVPSESNACTGALLMKKADLVNKPAEKLKLFRQGRHLLDNEISVYPENGYYRFIRLLIQENCPPLLDYKKNMKEDVEKIKQHYIELSPSLRASIADYAKRSAILKLNDIE